MSTQTPSRTGVQIVDGPAMPWVNGRDVYESMEPAFRENLDQHGDPDRVAELLSRYWLRALWLDPATSRRIDHVRTDPGYVDLCEAYHDSVEECLFRRGGVVLSAEGTMRAGDYFWRPPGWVHAAASEEGFDAVLMMEGESATEGSGRVSRVVCPDERAGENLRPESADDALGPRGYVRRLETSLMVWREHDDRVTGLAQAGVAALRSKVLSSNAGTGDVSAVVELPADWAAEPAVSDRERFLVLTEGSLQVDGQELRPCSLVRIAPGTTAPRLSSGPGGQLLVKTATVR